MQASGQTVEDRPKTPGRDDRHLRAELILEEALETITALGCRVYDFTGTLIDSNATSEGDLRIEALPEGAFDLLEAIDGCIDLIVVATGTLSTIGVPDVPHQIEVDNANLRKIGPDGNCEIRDGGKLLKPEGWTGPDHGRVLDDVFGPGRVREAGL
jgi:predicted HAD superfamily Cof-like phosphohydrolase